MTAAIPLPETLFGLLEQHSPSGQENGAVNYLTARMRQLGFQASVDQAGNAVGVRGSGSRQIVLLGHIDTVPGVIPIRQEGDLLYGRGSVDAKGPLAAFVDAASKIAIPAEWQVVVIGAVDEERNSIGASFVLPYYHPEAVIVGEPSHWDRITLGYKGSASAEICIVQSKAHTAGQERPACEIAVDLWRSLQGWAAEFNQARQLVFDHVLLSLRRIDTTEGDFEDRVRMRINARLPLDLPPNMYYQRLKQIADCCEVSELGVPVPAYRGDKQNRVARAFLGGIRAVGGEPGFLLKTGTADMNIAGYAWECPMVAYGPGDSTLDHTPDEHISVREYNQAVEVLTLVLQRLMR